MKKTYVTIITTVTILLCLGAGLFVWINKPFANSSHSAAEPSTSALAVVTVTPQPSSATILLSGKLQPLQVINISIPFSGKIERVYFHYGDVVKAGQILIAMDVTEAEVKCREAKAAYIKATENLRQVEAWATSTDVARASRSLTKARLSLENQKKSMDETERLLKKGIIPTNEYESAKQQHMAQQLDYQTAEEEMKAISEKGNKTNVQVARFEMQNAYSRMKQIEAEQGRAKIVAPADGVIMRPTGGGSGKEAKSVEQGRSFQQGEVVLAVGDLSGFSVTSKVDEIDVTKVTKGQKVRITGDAFPGIQLTGMVRTIAPQTDESDAQGAPSYAITVDIRNVTEEQRKKIFVGMSATLEILVYEKTAALMLPLSAVIIEGGKKYVLKKQPNALSVKVPVETGHTTPDSVEIIKGVNAGDKIEIQKTPQAGIAGIDSGGLRK
jgi:HlyD family secretion protein